MRRQDKIKICRSAGIIAAISVLLTAGCASWPTTVKVVAAPVAVVRDTGDLVLAPVLNGINAAGDWLTGPQPHFVPKEDIFDFSLRYARTYPEPITPHGGYWRDDRPLGDFGEAIGGVVKFIGFVLAAIDYPLFRSFCGGIEGKSPFKEKHTDWNDFLFPNIRELKTTEKTPEEKSEANKSTENASP